MGHIGTTLGPGQWAQEKTMIKQAVYLYSGGVGASISTDPPFAPTMLGAVSIEQAVERVQIAADEVSLAESHQPPTLPPNNPSLIGYPDHLAAARSNLAEAERSLQMSLPGRASECAWHAIVAAREARQPADFEYHELLALLPDQQSDIPSYAVRRLIEIRRSLRLPVDAWTEILARRGDAL